MINKTNYEGFLIDYLHNELAADQVPMLLRFMEEHPEVKAEFKLLQQTIVVADETIVFNHKALLYKEEKPVMKAVYPIKRYMAIAAVVSGLIIALFLFLQSNKEEVVIAKQDTSKERILAPKEKQVQPQVASTPLPNTPTETTTTTTESKKPQLPHVVTPKQPILENPSYQEKQLARSHENQAPQENPLPAIQETKIPIPQQEPAPEVIAKEPSIPSEHPVQSVEPLVANNSKTTRAIELNPKKQPALFKAINGLLTLKHKVKETKKSLEQTEVTVMVGNKVLFNINH